jgi:hypothetical protein
MSNQKKLILFAFLFSLLPFAPRALAVGEICSGNNTCCTPPQILVDGGGCPAPTVWIGSETTGSCINPGAYACTTSFNCSTNSCTSISSGAACPSGKVNLGGGKCGDALTVVREALADKVYKLWFGDILGRLVYVSDVDCANGDTAVWNNTTKTWVCAKGDSLWAPGTNPNDINNTNTGNVGIGTSTPAAKFDVNGVTRIISGSNETQLWLANSAAKSYGLFSTNNSSFFGGGKFVIYDNDDSASRLTIRKDGNVGIGIDNPTSKLEVIGTGYFKNLLIGNEGAEFSGGKINLNNNSNNDTNINTGTSTGDVSIGGGAGTVAINSTSWDVTSAGAASGFTSLGVIGKVTIADGTQGLGKVLTSDASGEASWQANSLPVFVGLTGATYTGNLNGGTTGYKAADQLCSDAYANSHVCFTQEVIQSYRIQPVGTGVHSATGNAHINNGPPGYFINAVNDCNGWATNNGSVYFGAIWMFNSDSALVADCSRSYAFACCK